MSPADLVNEIHSLGLTVDECRILAVIGTTGGAQNADIRKLVNKRYSCTSKYLQNLSRRGFIKATGAGHDKAGKWNWPTYVLTDKANIFKTGVRVVRKENDQIQPANQ